MYRFTEGLTSDMQTIMEENINSHANKHTGSNLVNLLAIFILCLLIIISQTKTTINSLHISKIVID